MKIDPTKKPLGITPPNKVPSTGAGDGTHNFANVLGKSLKTASTDSVQKGHISPPVNGPELRVQDDIMMSEWRAANGLLDALDAYRTQLKDPKASLKMVEPYVRKMKDLFENTQPVLDRLPEGHPIKEVVQETVVHMSKEIERFNMGFYVDE